MMLSRSWKQRRKRSRRESQRSDLGLPRRAEGWREEGDGAAALEEARSDKHNTNITQTKTEHPEVETE